MRKNNAFGLWRAGKRNTPTYSGIKKAVSHTNCDFRIFGKPSTRPYRRMAVALAFGNEPVNTLVEKAKKIANHIKIYT